VEDWENDDGIPTADFAALITGFGLHMCLVFFYTYAILHFFMMGNVLKLIVCIHCAILFAVRAASLMMAAYDVNAPPCSEFPTFVYFTLVIWVAASWVTVLSPILAKKQKNNPFNTKKVTLIWLAFSLPVYCFYIGIMIAEGTALDDPKLQTSCYGRISEGTPEWNSKTILTLIYRLVMLCIALTILIGVIILNQIMWDKIKGSYEKVVKRSKEIIALLVTVSFFFTCHCLSLLCFEVTKYQHVSAGVTLLLVFEIVPGLVIIALFTNPQGWGDVGLFGRYMSSGGSK